MFKFYSILFFIFFNIPQSKEDVIIRPVRIFNPFSPFENNNNNQESEPAVISKQSYTVNGPSGPIKVTHVHISRGKNLGGNSNRATPISMLSDLDSFFNDFFEQMIFGAKLAQAIDNMHRKQNQLINNENNKNIENNKNDEKKENIEKNDKMNFELDDENDKNKSVDKNVDTKEDKKNDSGVENTEKKNNNVKNNDKKDSMKKLNKKIKKLTRKISKKEVIFSRICKYIFYSIILFTVYILGKKFLAFLEVLDPDNGELFGGKIKGNEKPKEDEVINLKEKTKNQEIKNKENKQK